MTKNEYIEKELGKLMRSSLLAYLPYASLFVLALGALDYFVTPGNFSVFFIYRLFTAGVGIILFLMMKYARLPEKVLHNLVIFISTLAVTIMVELMIFALGGHQSTYYAGMIVVMIFVLGFIPMSVAMTAVIISLVYGVYAVPLLLFDEITNVRVFLNNNLFLSASGLGALGWRYFYQRLIEKNLSLEYDLSQDKEQLEVYSTRLEHLVEERTRELNKSELMLRSLFENANDGIVLMDRSGIIIEVNQKGAEIHGFTREAMTGTNIELLELEENKDEYRERLNQILAGESLMFETQHYQKDGGRVSLEVSAKAIEVEGRLLVQSFHRDITEKKRLQEQLFQSQKMDSIGVLAGGIAHDFNNILSAILGHAEILHDSIEKDEDAVKRLRIIETSARRAGQMISKLLSFARAGKFEIVPLNVNRTIRDTCELVERMMAKRSIKIQIYLDDAIPPISADENHLEQVFMNLIVNAADAMPRGGTITITTTVRDLGGESSRVHPLLAGGSYVLVTVADTGEGIPEKIRQRIFDPFFTTKEIGKGTGLGLAMVYGIVKELKGVITVKSSVGVGTEFDIYLPVSEKASVLVKETAHFSLEGREKIMVIDDEEDVLSFIRDVLEKRGYKVFSTSNPVYAIDMFSRMKDEIDLVVTDIMMPLINGRELVRRIRTIKPAVKVIAVSGYDGPESPGDGDVDRFITKPFQSSQLLSSVRELIGRRLTE